MTSPKHPRRARTSHPPLRPGESEEITFLRLSMKDASRKVFRGAELASIAVEPDSHLLKDRAEDLHASIGIRMPHAVDVDDLDRYHRAFNRELSRLIPKSLSRRIRTTVIIFTPSYFFSVNEITYPILLRIVETNKKLEQARSASARKKTQKEKARLLDELVATGYAVNTIAVDHSQDA